MSSTSLLRAWGQTDRTLRNGAAAVTARSLGVSLDSVVVGSDEITEQIKRSSAADFGLRGELPYIDSVITAVNEESNLLEKEHKIDLICWNEVSELSTFDYFNLNAVLAYLIKINLFARWPMLAQKIGRALFLILAGVLHVQVLINI